LDALTITFMLAAAVLHASWHSLVKSGSHGLAVLTGMCLVSALAAACVLPFVPPPPRSVWPILLLSIVLHSGYRLSLAQAYKHGDLSQAYPMARGMVPLIAAAFAVPLLGQVPTPGELLGIVIISAGLLALAGESFSRKIPGQLLVAAVLAAAAVAAYSAIDAYGIRTSGDWISYTAWLIALDGGIFFVVMCLLGGRPMQQDPVCDVDRHGLPRRPPVDATYCRRFADHHRNSRDLGRALRTTGLNKRGHCDLVASMIAQKAPCAI
jgi:drug/metabolite transporter (DMT)-like permease